MKYNVYTLSLTLLHYIWYKKKREEKVLKLDIHGRRHKLALLFLKRTTRIIHFEEMTVDPLAYYFSVVLFFTGKRYQSKTETTEEWKAIDLPYPRSGVLPMHFDCAG